MEAGKVKEFISFLGAMSEVLGVLYKDLVKQGFTPKQALQLVQTYMAITFTPKDNQ